MSVIHNNASSSEINHLSSSHQNQPTYLFVLFWTIFACKQCLVCAYFSPDSEEMTFSLEEVILWIMDLYFSWKQWSKVKNILMMDLFLTSMQLFTSQDVN